MVPQHLQQLQGQMESLALLLVLPTQVLQVL
jgi:hypothetical protein